MKRRRKAFLKFVITVLAIGTIAVIGYLILVFVLVWDGMTLLIPLLVVSVITGFYFQSGKQKIGQ